MTPPKRIKTAVLVVTGVLALAACGSADASTRTDPLAPGEPPRTARPAETQVATTPVPATVAPTTATPTTDAAKSETWTFRVHRISGWNYAVTIKMGYEARLSVDVSSSPPGQAKLAVSSDNVLVTSAQGIDAGRTPPSVSFVYPEAVYHLANEYEIRLEHPGCQLHGSTFACAMDGRGGQGLSDPTDEQTLRALADELNQASPATYLLTMVGDDPCKFILVPGEPVKLADTKVAGSPGSGDKACTLL